ncbi:MAG: gliding motility-associated C-terminal domain-containing protein, partial [Bacteroidota bacterium]|nr:gliding motility-associated C-terminal domain-containing protein [Bacteroidota bacterium]
LSYIEKPIASFLNNLSCRNQAINFTNNSVTINSGTITWTWNFGDNSSSNTFSPTHIYSQGGTYTITLVAQSNTCPQLSDTIRKQVNIKSAIEGIRYPTVRVVKNIPYPLSARNIGQQYLWKPLFDLNNPLIRTPIITTTTERTYSIKITSNDGCITTDTLLVQVYNKTEVFVPNAFTPNGNNANDVLRPIVVNIPMINFFKIYNRWGQEIFQTQKTGEGWDGKYKGIPQPTETYTWIFEGKDVDGNIIKASGKSILIR